jgi:hypothetical protein
MSLRSSQPAPRATACPPNRLDLVLRAGQHRLGKTVCHSQVGELAQLLLSLKTADIDGTGKRKVDGTYAATRLKQSTTEKWANERFRQVMLLVLEFRNEWPNKSLITSDDVGAIRTAVDNALFAATSGDHVGCAGGCARSPLRGRAHPATRSSVTACRGLGMASRPAETSS